MLLLLLLLLLLLQLLPLPPPPATHLSTSWFGLLVIEFCVTRVPS